MICPLCRAQIGRYDWQAHNVSGSLSISWRCPNGHHGQHNRVGMIISPAGTPRSDPPLAPVDFCQHERDKLDSLVAILFSREKESKMLSIKVKPSPSANIRRLAETGLSREDIRQTTGYSPAEIKRALNARHPVKL